MHGAGDVNHAGYSTSVQLRERCTRNKTENKRQHQVDLRSRETGYTEQVPSFLFFLR